MEFDRKQFERFTGRARKVLTTAQEEAQRQQAQMTGTEHILLALMRDGEGVAARVLALLGVKLEQLRGTILELQPQTLETEVSAQEFTPEAKKLIQDANDEARRLNYHYVGTEHLLLAIMRVPTSLAARALQALNIQAEALRTTTIQVISHSEGSSSSSNKFKTSTQRSASTRESWNSPQNRDRFDKFTERARKVLSLAQEEAQRFQHNYIGTEHLLLGLVREGEGIAARTLGRMGVSLEKVRNAVEFIIGRGDRIVLGEIGLTPRAKKVIELAVDEAHRLNHHYIGTEHLLLGLVREGEGIAAGVLESLGVRLQNLRREVSVTLGQKGVAADSERLAGNEEQYVYNTMHIVHHITQQLYQAIQFAEGERERLKHPSFGTEHILLGLLYDKQSVTALVFKELGIDFPEVYPAIEDLQEREERVYPWSPEHTPLARAQQDLAGHEAMRMNKDTIGNEHMLLALLHFPESNAMKILQKLGAEREVLRSKVYERLAAE